MTAPARVATSFEPAARTMFASGVLGMIGVVFLVAMFIAFAIGATSAGEVLGRVNDVLIMVAYPLAIPGLIALRGVVRPQAPITSDLAVLIAIGAIGAIAILQAALVLHWLTFEEQVGPVSVALLALGVSLVAIGFAGRSGGVLPGGLRMGLIGATYFGYPLWAWWAGRQIARRNPAPDMPGPSLARYPRVDDSPR